LTKGHCPSLVQRLDVDTCVRRAPGLDLIQTYVWKTRRMSAFGDAFEKWYSELRNNGLGPSEAYDRALDATRLEKRHATVAPELREETTHRAALVENSIAPQLGSRERASAARKLGRFVGRLRRD
jgi:hypothetical protein